MTNYNDSKWHRWNGGECPVHPESVVKVSFANGQTCSEPDKAGAWYWHHDGDCRDIHKFHVVKEYQEPRECWSYGAHIRDSLAEAEAFRADVDKANPGRGYGNGPITHWREVL